MIFHIYKKKTQNRKHWEKVEKLESLHIVKSQCVKCHSPMENRLKFPLKFKNSTR
jgi:hypothetical protein